MTANIIPFLLGERLISLNHYATTCVYTDSQTCACEAGLVNGDIKIIYEEERTYVEGGTRLIRDGNSMVLEVRSPQSERIACLIVSGAAIFPTFLFVFLLYQVIMKPSPWGIFVSLVLVGFLTIALILYYATLQSCFVRRFVFDFKNQICLFKHVPGCNMTIPFVQIEAIDLLVFYRKHDIASRLGIAIDGTKRRLRIKFGTICFKRNDPPDVVTAQLRPLAEALDGEFHESKYVNTNRVSQISYCLSQIGGEQVETALQKVITEHVNFDEYLNWRWEAVVCCSYAECAEERAVPLLVNLHNEATGENGNLQRVVALCALARTRNYDAMAIVFDNSDFLRKQLDGEVSNRWITSMISFTFQSIAEGKDETDLVSSPIYRQMWLGIHSPSRTTIIWNDEWDYVYDTDANRERWSRILQ